MRKLIYVAGPYRGKSESEVWRNIMAARDIAAEVWKKGYVAICPHLNTMLMGGILPDKRWLEGDLEILRRCDGIVLVSEELSSGVETEIDEALKLGMMVWDSIELLPDGEE